VAESVRLSEVSEQAAMALASFDRGVLEGLTRRMCGVADGRIALEAEPIEAILAAMKMLAEILIATDKNIHMLRRLRERKARSEWVL